MLLSEHVIQNRESTSCARACESRVHPDLFVLASCAYGCAFARWNFLLHTAKKNNNAVKCFVFQVKLVIRKASLAHHKSVP